MEKYVNYVTILPEGVLSLVAFVVMLLDAYTGGKQRRLYAWVALVGYAGAGGAVVWIARLLAAGSPLVPTASFSGMLVTDPFRLAFSTVALVVSALTALSSVHWLDEDDLPAGEFHTLTMFATVGMLLMASAGDLVMIFLGLEIVSIATYVMAGYRRRDLRSNEAGLKYYILGSFSTAFLLYGMALTYGATHSTNLVLIREAIIGGKVEWTWLLLVGGAMMLVGLCFKVAVAPFHVWTPDVYEGAPSVVTGWMSTGPKAAAFSAFLRLYIFIFAVGASASPLHLNTATVNALQIIAVTTMILGNVVAMVQDNIKRMLAYSSIAHAGYALVGLIANDWQAVAFYMLAYAVMNIGAFAVVATIGRRFDRGTTMEDYRGIGWESLGLSVALSIFMLSLAGFPMTAGFMGKLLVFKSAWQKGYTMLVVFGVLNSAVSVYYYLRPIVLMYFGAPGEAERRVPAVSVTTFAALAVALAGVFYLGLLPDAVLRFFAFGAR
jgi:NADH-quinone oxidoreductase subunit N